MEKVKTDKELQDWFLKFCKENQGCYVLTQDEKEAQDYKKDDLLYEIEELEVYGFNDNDEELVSLDDVRKLIKKIL